MARVRGLVIGTTGGHLRGVQRTGTYPQVGRRLSVFMYRSLLICWLLPCWPRERVKEKMAGSEESGKYSEKIFQEVGLFAIPPLPQLLPPATVVEPFRHRSMLLGFLPGEALAKGANGLTSGSRFFRLGLAQ